MTKLILTLYIACMFMLGAKKPDTPMPLRLMSNMRKPACVNDDRLYLLEQEIYRENGLHELERLRIELAEYPPMEVRQLWGRLRRKLSFIGWRDWATIERLKMMAMRAANLNEAL